MKIVIVMDSGVKYDIGYKDLSIKNFIGDLCNETKVLKNSMIKLEENIYINPSHISSIETYECKKQNNECDSDDPLVYC